MDDKISNTIALHQNTIETLKKIKQRVEESETEDIKLKFETKHWYGYSEPFLMKRKHRLEASKYSIIAIIDCAIKIERERIDKLIDMEIEKRKEKR